MSSYFGEDVEMADEEEMPEKIPKRKNKIIIKEEIDETEDEDEYESDRGYNFGMDERSPELDKEIKLPDVMFGGISDMSFGFDDKNIIGKGVKNLRKTAKKNIKKPRNVSFEPKFDNIFGGGWG